MTREQKITLGEMRASGVLGLLVYCADYRCGHLAKDQRGSMAGPLFVCQSCVLPDRDLIPSVLVGCHNVVGRLPKLSGRF